jgi:hypothetical protein
LDSTENPQLKSNYLLAAFLEVSVAEILQLSLLLTEQRQKAFFYPILIEFGPIDHKIHNYHHKKQDAS